MSPVSSIVSDIQQIPHIFYIIPYFLFIARMLKLYKQNKEDRILSRTLKLFNRERDI